jgi:hypothetical protein
LEATLQASNPGPKIRREREPLDRIRRTKGKTIRETSARLGNLKVLGGDAEILVLREVEENTPKPAEPTPELVEKPVVPDIHDAIQQENRTPTSEEVHARLESLRPKFSGDPSEPHYVTQKTFVRLIRKLVQGFTQRQLSQFYSVAKNLQEAELPKEVLASLREEKDTTRPTTRTNWQPGITPMNRRLPGADVSMRSKRAPVSKQLLVDRIMRDVWKLVPLEEVEAAGELELTLKPWQLALLNAGSELCLPRASPLELTDFQRRTRPSTRSVAPARSSLKCTRNTMLFALQPTRIPQITPQMMSTKLWIRPRRISCNSSLGHRVLRTIECPKTKS